MTMRVPGEECLTKTQEAQRAFRKKFVEKSQDPLAANSTTGVSASKEAAAQVLPDAITPAARGDVSLVVAPKTSTGTVLNVTA